MSAFLITGLPRSRTAWLSVVATGKHSFCHHEPLKHTTCFEEYAAFWERPTLPFNGIADSGIVPQLGRVLAQIEPRTLIVRRDIAQVKASLAKAFEGYDLDISAGDKYLEACNAELKIWLNHPLVKAVDYDELNDPATVDDCMRWLMPWNEAPFNRALMGFNIQADIKSVMDAKNVNQWCLP